MLLADVMRLLLELFFWPRGDILLKEGMGILRVDEYVDEKENGVFKEYH